MLNLKRLKATTAVVLALGMNAGAIAPIAAPMLSAQPAIAQNFNSSFRDVPSNYWAANFIEALVSRGVIAGFPDGTFRPDAPVTRAQFSSMLQAAFNNNRVRNAPRFVDVPNTHWAASAISRAYETGFLAGYPGNIFQPEQNIPREQVLVSLANGLNYSASNSVDQVLGFYNDQVNISNFARSPIAAATERRMVVNHPSLSSLNPRRNATRAEVAAFLYQALVSQGTAPAISSSYIVSPTPVAVDYRIPAGTNLPVSYQQEKILLMANETLPVTFSTTTNVLSREGQLLIPVNSQVRGKLVPAGSGTRFVAEQIVFPNGQTRTLDAQSNIITEKETIRQGTNAWNVVRNAALGTAAAAAISAVTGDRAIATEEVLIGTGVGALTTLIQSFLGRNSVDVLVVKPDTNLNLTLNSDFVVSAR
ncbi:S-layer homology domain-containing protein [Spirulina subsalsa]|uniref:S-layer homology domain-containing protein n=1 Tax=Spirulina subsalsa TaxID=54311 RepID=UPI0002E45640|nr:S-layer homology domain-containing protein [Spirulina subsalsa]